MFPGPDWFRGWPALFCWSWGPSAVLASLLAALSPHQDSVLWLEEAPPARGPPEAALWTRTPPLPGAAPLPGRLVSECGSTEDPGWREHRRPWLLPGKYLYQNGNVTILPVRRISSIKLPPLSDFPHSHTYLFGSAAIWVWVKSASKSILLHKWKIAQDDLDGLDVALSVSHSIKGTSLHILFYFILCPAELLFSSHSWLEKGSNLSNYHPLYVENDFLTSQRPYLTHSCFPTKHKAFLYCTGNLPVPPLSDRPWILPCVSEKYLVIMCVSVRGHFISCVTGGTPDVHKRLQLEPNNHR